MSVWSKLAWRELRNNPRFSLFFALNLALGLLGFVLLDSFKIAFSQALDQRSRNLLSADLAISSRRKLNADELRLTQGILDRMAGPGVREQSFVSMFTMVRGPTRSRLVELNAIDAGYPFYGELELGHGGKIRSETAKELLQKPVAWVYPELGVQLGLEPGAPNAAIQLGKSRFQVTDVIRNDTGNAWRGFSLASRVYVGLPFLQETGLVQKGSTVTYTRFFAFPPQAHGVDAEKIAKALNHALTDPAIRIRTHRQASEEVGRLIDYLNDFLGLVALVALFLSGIGSAYLFRSYLSRKVREIAILEALGASPAKTRGIYLLQLSLLGLLSAAFTLVVSAFLLPVVSYVVGEAIPLSLDLSISPRTALLTLALGGSGSLLICLPLLQKLKGLKPGDLFQESADPTLTFSRRQAWGVLPALICFWALSVWQAHSWVMGNLFVALFLGSGVILSAGGGLALAFLRRLDRTGGYIRRSAFRNLHRSPLSSLSCFISIGMGALLLNLVPAIQKNIQSEFTEPEGLSLPGLFVFDIQDEQLEPLKKYVATQNLPLANVSPMVRSRLNAINGKTFEKLDTAKGPATREEEQDQRFRNRGFNLTYRDRLQESETLTRGKLWSAPYTAAPGAVPEVSVEHRFADRLGIHFGDVLDFDVEGIPIRGKVTSLRKIRWTSFQPNFFILFQPGVLDGAPKTFIANLPGLTLEQKIAIQNGVIDRFPNVSMVDVSELVTKVLAIFRQMGSGIQAMAWLTLVAGFVVLFSIANHQASAKSQESNLLKVLGAPFRQIRGIIQIEFGALGLFAAAVGTLLSYGVSYIISVVVFEGVWVFTWRVPVLSILAVTVLSVGVATLATRRVLRRRPIELLTSA